MLKTHLVVSEWLRRVLSEFAEASANLYKLTGAAGLESSI